MVLVPGNRPDEIDPDDGSTFNLDDDAASRANGEALRQRDWTVSEVSARVRSVLTDGLPVKLRVVGEISNLSNRTHWFFSLKDEQSTISCVCFASAASRVGFDVSDGLRVVATGRVDYYENQGRLQFYVDRLEPLGQGALELQFQALCEKLRGLGYFDPSVKKPLPLVPRRVAVVTSRAAAALQDVIHTAQKRWAGCRLVLCDVRVQGRDAAGEIASAIDMLSRYHEALKIDAIILTRGGGSIEDLWAFNERVVADAVYGCDLPIIAAIGHETDTTIAELVADMRCATPTQAAMTLIPDEAALRQQVDQIAQRLGLLLHRQFDLSRHQLRSIVRHPVFARPQRLLEAAHQRLTRLNDRLANSLPGMLQRQQDLLEALTKQLEAVSPSNVLRRGYSYTLTANGRLLCSVEGVTPGDTLTTVLAEGQVTSRVVDHATTPGRAQPLRPRRKKKPRDTGQAGLFDSTQA